MKKISLLALFFAITFMCYSPTMAVMEIDQWMSSDDPLARDVCLSDVKSVKEKQEALKGNFSDIANRLSKSNCFGCRTNILDDFLKIIFDYEGRLKPQIVKSETFAAIFLYLNQAELGYLIKKLTSCMRKNKTQTKRYFAISKLHWVIQKLMNVNKQFLNTHALTVVFKKYKKAHDDFDSKDFYQWFNEKLFDDTEDDTESVAELIEMLAPLCGVEITTSARHSTSSFFLPIDQKYFPLPSFSTSSIVWSFTSEHPPKKSDGKQFDCYVPDRSDRKQAVSLSWDEPMSCRKTFFKRVLEICNQKKVPIAQKKRELELMINEEKDIDSYQLNLALKCATENGYCFVVEPLIAYARKNVTAFDSYYLLTLRNNDKYDKLLKT